MPEPDPEKEARRIKRELKRAKQREANILRAAKMHQARLSTAGELFPLPPAQPPVINIGCSGWFYWHWRGIFYPEDLATKDWFDHYSSQFKTVELNAPFYSWPTLANVALWKRQTGRRKFIYTIKVCELITHIKRFTGTKELVKDFGYIADLLGPQMGCFLFQLPPSFHYTKARLKSIVSQLDPRHHNVVEFRHASWWNEEVYTAFRTAGIIFCSCSGPRLPDILVKTADDIYIRFHGKTQWYRHDYSQAELQEWASRIKISGAKNVWAYFNNDRDGHAIRNAKSLSKLLGKNSPSEQIGQAR